MSAYEPLIYKVEGCEGKLELILLLEAILDTIKKDPADSFKFKIKIEAKK